MRKNQSFSIMLISVLFLTIGSKLYEIILPLMMYELSHSSVIMANMRTAELLPNFFFAILIGVIVDRVDQKRWVIWMIGLQALLLLLFVLLYKMNTQAMYAYYVLGFLLMTLNYGYFNAQVSLVKRIVPSPQLTMANARLSLTETLVSILGPALSGLVLMLPDTSDGIVLTAICYGLCLLLFSQLTLPHQTDSRPRSSFWQEIKEGWLIFCANRSLWMLTGFVIFVNCTSCVVSMTTIYYAKDVLQLSSAMLALALSASGIGGLAAGLLTSKWRSRFGLGKVYGCSVLTYALAYLLLSFSASSLFLFVVALLAIGFATSLHTITVYAFRQEQTPADVMGRIAGITGTLFRFGMPLAMYASGYLIEWYGGSVIFVASAIWNAVIGVVLLKTHLWKVA
nr:MFS transporter [Brevibacillus fulvus]